MTRAEEESVKWWNKRIKEQIKKNESPEDYVRMSRRKIGPGSMITFSYKNPKTPLKYLKFFDVFPCVVLFSDSGRHFTGLNLHYAPRPFRKTILAMVIKLNKMNIKNDRRFQLSWEKIKEFVVRNGLKLLIRKYIKARMTNVDYVKGVEWKYAAELPSHKFVLDGNMTEDQLWRLIYSQGKATKSAKNTRFGRST